MESVKITLISDEKASRMELIIRFIWGSLVAIVLGAIGIVAGIAFFLQWLHILVRGQRHGKIQNFINSYGIAVAQLKFYGMLSTDERPPLIPKF